MKDEDESFADVLKAQVMQGDVMEMGSLRNLKKTADTKQAPIPQSFQRTNPVLSKATVVEVKEFVLHTFENQILDLLAEKGEWPLSNYSPDGKACIGSTEILALPGALYGKAVQNLLDGNMIREVHGHDDRTWYGLTNPPSDLPDLQFKILDYLGKSLPRSEKEIKDKLNWGPPGLRMKIAEVRAALKDLEKAGFAKRDKDRNWIKV